MLPITAYSMPRVRVLQTLGYLYKSQSTGLNDAPQQLLSHFYFKPLLAFPHGGSTSFVQSSVPFRWEVLQNNKMVNNHVGPHIMTDWLILTYLSALYNNFWLINSGHFKIIRELWWSYGSWNYNWLSPLTLRVRILLRWGVLRYNIMWQVCEWLAASW